MMRIALSVLWLLLAHLESAKSQTAPTADMANAYLTMAHQSIFHKINYYTTCRSLARSVWLM